MSGAPGSSVPGGNTGGGTPGSTTTSPTTSPSHSPVSSPSSSPTTSPSGAPSSSPGQSPSAAPASVPSGPSPPAAPGGIERIAEGDPQYDFGSIFGDDWFGDPAVAPPATPTPQEPAAPQVSTPVVAQPSAPDAQQAPAPQGQPAIQTSEASRLDPGDPSGIAQAMLGNRNAFIEHLAQTQYQLSPEDMAGLEADVTTAIPRLLARAQVETMTSMLTHMGRSVPLMVQRFMEVSKARSAAEDAFYSRWPDIRRDDPKVAQIVQQYAVTFRSMHPQVPMQEMIEKVGPMVMMAAQIVPGSSQTQKGPNSLPSGAPQTVPNGRAAAATPFVPALPGAAHAAPVPDPNDNFGWMGQND